MSNAVTIVDYGMGNLHSVRRKLGLLDCRFEIARSFRDIEKADKLILPGVGHFGKAMEHLNDLGLLQALHEAVIVQKKPVLGICLGMQLMALRSDEGNVQGLGWFDAEVVRFEIKDTLKHKVPHTGWNQIDINKKSALMEGIKSGAEFYFVHSYHIKPNVGSDILNTTDYEYRFVSAIERGNIFGVQYHPEKSHDAGLQLFKNFIHL